MASEDWIQNLPIVCHTLFGPMLMCQQDLQEKLDEIAAEFIWLSEIADETYKLFAIKSSRLEQMPQTPSMKKTKQERNVQKIKTSYNSNSISGTIVSKQLQFKREHMSINSKTVNKPGIDVLRTSKTANIEKIELSKILTQHSRNSISENKSSKLKMSKKWSPGHDEVKENKQPVKDRRFRVGSNEEAKEKAPFPSRSNKKSDEKCKSVSAHDIVLKHGVSKSLVKLGNADKMTHVVSKLDVSRRDCGSGKLIYTKRSSGDSKPCALQPIKSYSVQPLQNIAKHTSKHKIDVDTSKAVQNSAIESSNLLSGLCARSQFSLLCEKNKGLLYKDTTDRDNSNTVDDIKSTQCQSDLNETVTVVTEFFEISKDQTVRLKEFEIVKTKTEPVNAIIKSEANFVLTNSRSNLQYSPSDQGFNDNYDGSTNESSCEVLVDGNYSTGNEFGNDLSTEDEINVLPSTQARTQGTNEMTIMIKTAEPNKDSGIVSGTIKPVSFVSTTLTKDVMTSKHNDRTTGSRNKQKEPITKNVYADIIVRHTKTGQSQIKIGDVNQSRNIKKWQAEGKSLSPKCSCKDDLNSMLQEQKRQKLLENENCSKERLRKAAELRKQKVEDLKKLREKKEQKVTAAQEMRWCCEQEQKEKVNKKFETKTVLNKKLVEETCKEEKNMQKQRLKKQKDANIHKKEKEEERQGEEAKMQKKLMQSKEAEKAEQKTQIAEERKKLEEQLADCEQKYKEEKLRLKQEKEEKEKEREFLRMQKEKQIALDRAEQERIDREKREKKNKQILEELEKLKSMEEKTKIQKELMRNKEIEEAKQKTQIAEERKKLETEQFTDCEQQHKEEKLRLNQEKEKKEKEREFLKMQKEKQIALERAEQERIDREKREEKNRKILEAQEKLKSMERQRLQLQQEKMQQHHELQQSKVSVMDSEHCSSPSKITAASIITNTKQKLDNVSNNNATSYEITPVKKNISKISGNPDNYNLEDKGSDDSTDCEEDPKKIIPEWATGIPLNTALIRQHMNPPDLELIFRISVIEPPDLIQVFPNVRRPRFRIRTSSAIWNSPPLSQH